MEAFSTGANVAKTASGYTVEYQNQIVGQFTFKECAMMLAMDRIKLQSIVQDDDSAL